MTSELRVRCSPRARLHDNFWRVATGTVVLLDPCHFNSKVEDAKRTNLSAQEARLDTDFRPRAGQAISPAASARKTSRVNALARLAKLWSPFNKRLVLSAIRVGADRRGNHILARSPTEQLDALRRTWAPVFASTPVDVDKGRDFLKEWAVPLDFSTSRPPNLNDYVQCL